MSLTITTLLTLVAMSTNVYSNAPRTSYLKAIDVWLMVCFCFCFAVMLAYSVLITCSTNNKEKKKKTADADPAASRMLRKQRMRLLNTRVGVAFLLLYVLFCIIFFTSLHGMEVPDTAVEGYSLEKIEEYDRTI